MNTVSSTDGKSNRSGSQQDTDTTLSTTRPPQKSASTSRTSSSSSTHHYSSPSVGLANDDCFLNEDSSTSTSYVNPYCHHPDFTSHSDEQYGDNDLQQLQQHQHHKLQQQQQQKQQRRLHQQQQQLQQYQDQPLQDTVRDSSSLADSSRYQGRQGTPLQTQRSSTLSNQLHSHPQVQSPQFPYQEHHASYEDQHHDQQHHQPGGGLRFDDNPSRIRQLPSRRAHLLSRDQHEPFDDDDDDGLEDFLDQELPSISSQTHESAGPLLQQITSTFQRPPRPNSSHEVHSNNFITEEEFLHLADDYLLSLSPKKREKALLSNAMYQKILMVLLQPKNTQVSTAQFRFWAKKMFTLSTTETHHIVCHSGKPVATKECLYDVLVYCHRKSSHGGRDKTSAEVRQHYSWVPKELIARFVKHCPLCSSRRHSLQRSLSGTGLSSAGFELFVPSSVLDGRNDQQHHFSASPDFSGRSSQLDQYSMIEPGQIGHDEAIHLNPPQDYRMSQGSLSSSTLSTDRTQQHTLTPSQLQHGARLHAEHMMQLQHQRMQTESSLSRYYDDRLPLRSHGRLRSSSSSVHDISSIQLVPRGIGRGFIHSDSSGVGASGDRIEGLQSTIYLDGPRRHGDGGWSRDLRIKVDTNQDVEMLGEGSNYNRDESDGARRSSHSGVEPLLLRGGHTAEANQEEERGDDCTPGGLVGIPHEVRATGSGSTGAIRRNSQNATYNCLYLQQQHQHQHQGTGGLTQYPPGHFHQGADPGASSSQPMSMSSSSSNQHAGVLSSRGSVHSRLVMEYPYGYPYLYNSAIGSNSMVCGPIKQSHGSFQSSPQQQQQQQQQQQLQRQSMLMHSTPTTFSQMVSGPLGGTFQEMRDYRNEEDRHQGDQMVHVRDKGNDRYDPGQGSDFHNPSS